ncbi:hypothetical protein XENTR_v10021033 [Xenopus tropicalis]|nr:hypothetical protein XENTR_v10021033 [Xenopus tropicalis]
MLCCSASNLVSLFLPCAPVEQLSPSLLPVGPPAEGDVPLSHCWNCCCCCCCYVLATLDAEQGGSLSFFPSLVQRTLFT